MALGKAQVALDIIRSRFNDSFERFPTKEEVLLILGIHLSCKGLHEGFLYCRSVWQSAGTEADHLAIAQQCTTALCEWSEQNHKTSALMEMPFSPQEELHLREYFFKHLQSSGTTANPKLVAFWPLYLVMRRRYIEAHEALKEMWERMGHQSDTVMGAAQSNNDSNSQDVLRHLAGLIEKALSVLPSVQKRMTIRNGIAGVEEALRILVHEGSDTRGSMVSEMTGSSINGSWTTTALPDYSSSSYSTMLGNAPLSSCLIFKSSTT